MKRNKSGALVGIVPKTLRDALLQKRPETVMFRKSLRPVGLQTIRCFKHRGMIPNDSNFYASNTALAALAI